jgi:hypothetical protein
VAEARWLERFGLGLHPELVVVCTSLNDYDVAPRYTPTGILAHDDPARHAPGVLERSEFLTLLRWTAAWARGHLWWQLMAHVEDQTGPGGPNAQVAAGLVEWVERTHLGFYHQPDPAYWARLRGAYLDFGRLTRDHRIRLLVAILPESYQVGVPAPDLTPQQRLLGLCREARLRCLDLQPVFAAAGGELFADAPHPNGRGHAVAAAAIAETLGSPSERAAALR